MKNFIVPVLLVSCLISFQDMSAQEAGPVITSSKVSTVSARNADSPDWTNAAATTVDVLPQMITNPNLPKASIKNLKVKSIHDGKTIAFLVEWVDSSRDAIVDVDLFCDQMAIQFPMDLSKNPNFMMGNKNGRVHIIHWKAAWQDDIEKGFRDVKDAYPNYWTDIYPLKEKAGDGEVAFARDIRPDQFTDPRAKNYMHGAYAGNPMSIFDRKDPSEECVAEGFGTLTTQETQNASAWGVWQNNTWKVIFTRPLQSTDTNDAPLPASTKMSFAVWNGVKENIGSKKHYSVWVDLKIKE